MDGRLRTASLLFIDLDDFKGLNDSYGHLVADAALRNVAVATQSVIADDEGLCCRWGGDKFAVLLPGAECAQAEQVARDRAEHLQRLLGIADAALAEAKRSRSGAACTGIRIGPDAEAHRRQEPKI